MNNFINLNLFTNSQVHYIVLVLFISPISMIVTTSNDTAAVNVKSCCNNESNFVRDEDFFYYCQSNVRNEEPEFDFDLNCDFFEYHPFKIDNSDVKIDDKGYLHVLTNSSKHIVIQPNK